MEFFEVVKKRASVRGFQKSEVPDLDVVKILDAGRRAPSGRTRQPFSFLVIRDEEMLTKLGRVQSCISQAPVAIGVIVDTRDNPYWREDAGAVIENMLLAATALGYGSLWVQEYVGKNQKELEQDLGIPGDQSLLAILPIGKPEGEPMQAAKKDLQDIVHAERYGQKYISS